MGRDKLGRLLWRRNGAMWGHGDKLCAQIEVVNFRSSLVFVWVNFCFQVVHTSTFCDILEFFIIWKEICKLIMSKFVINTPCRLRFADKSKRFKHLWVVLVQTDIWLKNLFINFFIRSFLECFEKLLLAEKNCKDYFVPIVVSSFFPLSKRTSSFKSYWKPFLSIDFKEFRHRKKDSLFFQTRTFVSYCNIPST